MKNRLKPILFALSAAVFYAINVPVSKLLMAHVGEITMAGLLYLGAGVGVGALCIAFFRGESLPDLVWIAAAMALGFAAYGLSIFLYVRAQSALGAAKTSACYAAAPFVGAALPFLILREELSGACFAALAVVLAGSALAAADTLVRHHTHEHTHTFTTVENGAEVVRTVTHSHPHDHYVSDERHGHTHPKATLEALLPH